MRRGSTAATASRGPLAEGETPAVSDFTGGIGITHSPGARAPYRQSLLKAPRFPAGSRYAVLAAPRTSSVPAGSARKAASSPLPVLPALIGSGRATSLETRRGWTSRRNGSSTWLGRPRRSRPTEPGRRWLRHPSAPATYNPNSRRLPDALWYREPWPRDDRPGTRTRHSERVTGSPPASRLWGSEESTSLSLAAGAAPRPVRSGAVRNRMRASAVGDLGCRGPPSPPLES